MVKTTKQMWLDVVSIHIYIYIYYIYICLILWLWRGFFLGDFSRCFLKYGWEHHRSQWVILPMFDDQKGVWVLLYVINQYNSPIPDRDRTSSRSSLSFFAEVD